MKTNKVQQMVKAQNAESTSKDGYTQPMMKRVKMELGDDELHIQIQFRGLWGKYYKLHIDENSLTVSALRWIPGSTLDNRAVNGDIATISSSFLLPCPVKDKDIWSEVTNGLLDIKIPVFSQAHQRLVPNYRQINEKIQPQYLN